MTLISSTTRPCVEQLVAALSLAPDATVLIHERIAWEYCSSYPIEELVISVNGGPTERVLFKDLSPRAMLGDARRVKLDAHRDPLREIAVYRHVLASQELSTPGLRGFVADPDIERYWLFMEKVEGLPLWQVGEFEAWLAAARLLGRMHRQMSVSVPELTGPARLIRYNGDTCKYWLDRAGRFAPSLASARRSAIEQLVAGGAELARRFDALPVTFVHGEFYASNVLIEDAAGSPRVRPVDWEMAGVGPGLIDLAAITAGKWTSEQRAAFAEEYRAAGAVSEHGFEEAFDLCRLYLAVHCLGWSPSWSPPAEHAFDWLGEAIQLATKLGLLR